MRSKRIQQKGNFMIDDKILVKISGADKPALLHGPVYVTVLVKNISDQPVQVVLPYPNPNNLTFECTVFGFALPKRVPRAVIERTVPIKIEPHQAHSAVYYVNRYLDFQKAGKASLSFRLEFLATTDVGNEQIHYENLKSAGQFAIELIQGSQEDLRNELARYAAKLEGNNRQAGKEAAEALGFLDTPVCVDYVAHMLAIDNLEVNGIKALGRFPSAKTNSLILGMLSHKEYAVVSAALDVIDAQRIPVTRELIRELLKSENPNIRLLALEWLAARLDQGDRESVSPLLSDSNPVVREKANAYDERLKR